MRYGSPTKDTHTKHAFRNVCTENAPGSSYRENVCCSLVVVVAMQGGSNRSMPAQPNCQFTQNLPSTTLFTSYFGNKNLMEMTISFPIHTVRSQVGKAGIGALSACIREGLAHACHHSWRHAR